jgi:hypothetical protein
MRTPGRRRVDVNVKVTGELLTALMPRRVGLRIYSDSLKNTFEVAQYRELWRVLESAFACKGYRLVNRLTEYPPAQELGFDHKEIHGLLKLRGCASHAESKKGIEELMAVGPQYTQSLARLKNLAERVIATKKSWSSPIKDVDEVLPLSGYVGPDDNAITLRR